MLRGTRGKPMKFLLAFAIAAGLAGSAAAEAPAPMPTPDNGHSHALYRSSKIVGSAVRDPHNKKIGDIRDLVLDRGRGEVAYAIVNFGGVMGVGAKYHAVPWQALQPSDDGKFFILHADRETISHAPGFDRSRWPDLSSPRWSAEVDRYWSRRVGRFADGNRLPPDTGGADGARPEMQNSGR
ncbi:PRC-barrel domain containing protein [Oxalobacteraceae bacterium OM1]|nr:PRC-barrel domain containing protein [Oxalobacteraceae bacterium OM1]